MRKVYFNHELSALGKLMYCLHVSVTKWLDNAKIVFFDPILMQSVQLIQFAFDTPPIAPSCDGVLCRECHIGIQPYCVAKFKFLLQVTVLMLADYKLEKFSQFQP